MITSEQLEYFHIENWFAFCISVCTEKTSEKALEEMGIKPMKQPPKKLNLTYEQALNIEYLRKTMTWMQMGEEYGINAEALRQQVYKAKKLHNKYMQKH